MGSIQRIAVKIGSNVLTDAQGFLNTVRMNELVRQISGIRKSGIEVVIISSGAVASGRGIFQPRQKLDTVGQRQMWSSLGQVKLIQSYSQLFEKYGILCSQILVTRDDFRSREHYLNMKNCLRILLTHGIIPIINENDVVSVTELMFTDNDELAALVASMLNVNSLIILTSVDGIYQTDEQGNQQLIGSVGPGEKEYQKHVNAGKSAFGKGGMLTKANMASKAAEAGIEVIIANGLRDNILTDLMERKGPFTLFRPSLGKSNIKKWLSHAKGFEKGSVVINDGALNALRSGKASSLLPVGIVQVEGTFKKGDIITIVDMQKTQVGLGMSQYDDVQTREKIGKQNQRPLIHYDYLFLL